MASDTKPATWAFNLRGTTDDRAILQRVVEAHAKMGLTISMNQAALILIRRGATPDADTEEEAREAIEQHWDACTLGCSRTTIKCPEGWRLRDAWVRVHDRPTPAAAQRSALTRFMTRKASA